MALVSLDKDDPPKYWGGRDSLAEAIGYDMPDAPEDGDQSPEAAEARLARARGQKAADKVIQALVQRGALLRLRSGNFRSHAVFALMFPASEVPPEGVATPNVEVPPHGVPRTPLKGDVGPPSWGMEGPLHGVPNEYEEKERESEGMRGRPSAGPRARPTLKRLPAESPDIETERRRQMNELQKKIDGFGTGAA